MKHRIATLAICLAFIASSGCMSVEKAINGMPQVSGDRVHMTKATVYGSMQVDAVNLRQTPDAATADNITVQVSAPGAGTVTISIDGYRREKRPAPEAAP